jgi:hypothetical protein
MMTTLMNSVETDKAGVASAVNGAIRETGFAFGIALLGTIMNQRYRSELGSSAEFNALRDTSNPQLAPLKPVLDLIERGVNFGGRVIQNTDIFPGLPEAVTEPIRMASSRAFVAGMEQAFVISSTATVIAAGVAWMLIRDEAITVESTERQEAEQGSRYMPEPSSAD